MLLYSIWSFYPVCSKGNNPMDLNQDCLEANNPCINERRNIVGALFLSLFMEVWLGTILLKDPIIPKNVIPIF